MSRPLSGLLAPILMLLAAWLQLGVQYLAASLRAHARFGAVSLGAAVQVAIGGGLGIAWVWRWGVNGLLVGWLVGTLVALLFMRARAPETPLAPSHPREGWALARAGLPTFAFFVTTLVLRSADRLALVRYGTPEDLGLYSLGLMAAGLVLYLPEAASYVLFPRVAAAFRGAGDRDRIRGESERVHRAIALLVPSIVCVGVPWIGPLVERLAPAYHAGVPAIRMLAIGATALSASTVPAYYLLASGRRTPLIVIGSVAAALNALLVFAVAARDSSPLSVAIAATCGYSFFAVGVLALVARQWRRGLLPSSRLVAASVVPALWAGGFALVACGIGKDESLRLAAWRSVAVLGVMIPIAILFGRGLGLRSLVREWLAPRVTSPTRA